MAPYSKTVRLILTAVFIALIGLLVLQALGYGVGFAVDPESGVKEFGYEEPTVVESLTVALVGSTRRTASNWAIAFAFFFTEAPG